MPLRPAHNWHAGISRRRSLFHSQLTHKPAGGLRVQTCARHAEVRRVGPRAGSPRRRKLFMGTLNTRYTESTASRRLMRTTVVALAAAPAAAAAAAARSWRPARAPLARPAAPRRCPTPGRSGAVVVQAAEGQPMYTNGVLLAAAMLGLTRPADFAFSSGTLGVVMAGGAAVAGLELNLKVQLACCAARERSWGGGRVSSCPPAGCQCGI